MSRRKGISTQIGRVILSGTPRSVLKLCAAISGTKQAKRSRGPGVRTRLVRVCQRKTRCARRRLRSTTGSHYRLNDEQSHFPKLEIPINTPQKWHIGRRGSNEADHLNIDPRSRQFNLYPKLWIRPFGSNARHQGMRQL